jgi:hypothetical protein
MLLLRSTEDPDVGTGGRFPTNIPADRRVCLQCDTDHRNRNDAGEVKVEIGINLGSWFHPSARLPSDRFARPRS